MFAQSDRIILSATDLNNYLGCRHATFLDLAALRQPKAAIEPSDPHLELLTALGGHYVIRTETTTALDGIPPKRFVVLAFDSKEKAQGWADAADIKAINAIRGKTTKSRAFIVEGFAN